jgi:ABC-type sugar transport system ATPase subunit
VPVLSERTAHTLRDIAGHRGEVEVYESLGEEGILEVNVEGSPVIVLTDPGLGLQPGETVEISMDWRRANLFDQKTGKGVSANAV